MAIDPSVEYPGQIDTTTDPTGYPLGMPQNDVVEGDGSGTPLEAEWVKDVFGHLQALLAAVGESPSGTADKVGASQYLDAYETLSLAKIAGAALSNWVARTPANAYAGTFTAVVPGNSAGVFLAVGTLGEIQASATGASWAHRTQAAAYADTFNDAVWSGTLWCIVGENGEIQTSPDSVTWTHRTAAAAYTGDFHAVCHSGSLFCAVGSAGEIQTSPDGITWTHRSAAAAYADTFLDVCFGGGIFVAVGQNGEIQTSPDGITWTHRTAAGSYTADFRAVAHNGEKFCAVGQAQSAKEVQTSVDGTTWVVRAANTNADWGDVTTVGKCFVIGASAGGAIEISPGGHSWRFLEAGTNVNGIAIGKRNEDGAYVGVAVQGGATGIRSSLFF